ncbi:zinc knuckle CX2CX4HX4C containing protein [Tanacetum coccineum]
MNSFASILKDSTFKKTMKIVELRNNEKVEGAVVAILLDAVDEVSNRFVNTLYGYFIGKDSRSQLKGKEQVLENGPWLIRLMPIILNIWTPNARHKKDEIIVAPVWVKLHNVPIVTYSEIGLSLITTKLGRPIMLDAYTSTMCLKSWGCNTYARALIEVSSKKDDKCPKQAKDSNLTQVLNDGFVENSFDSLMEKDKKIEVNNETRKASNDVGSIIDDSDSEEVEIFLWKIMGNPLTAWLMMHRRILPGKLVFG